MAAGFSCIVAAAQVYFRDLAGFIPHVLRIWLYSTPILYTAQEATDRGLGFLMWLNPMAPLDPGVELGDRRPEAAGRRACWRRARPGQSLFFVVGILYFVSRERELAVRI